MPFSVSWAFWDRKVGPFFDDIGVMNVAALTTDELQTSRHFGDILALEVDDHDFLYPTFQFGDRGELLPRLRDVVQVLRPSMSDEWDIALWLRTASNRLDGRSPARLLQLGQAPIAISAAVSAAACWSQANTMPVT